jgi:hypothetical protein
MDVDGGVAGSAAAQPCAVNGGEGYPYGTENLWAAAGRGGVDPRRLAFARSASLANFSPRRARPVRWRRERAGSLSAVVPAAGKRAKLAG